jgi:hypothetical protein
MTDSPQGLVERYAGHTDGPWFWHTDSAGRVSIRTPDRGQLIVMDFARRGMQSAGPRFAVMVDEQPRGRRGGILKTVDPTEHPDGRLIEDAPALLARALAAEAALREAQKDAERYLDALKWVDFQLSDTPLFLRIEGHNALANVMDEVFGKVRSAIDAARKVGTEGQA